MEIVIDFNQGASVQDALVIVTDGKTQSKTQTDGSGNFSLNFDMTVDKKLSLITSKDGFSADTLVFLLKLELLFKYPKLN